MQKHIKPSLQSIKVAASKTLKTRVVVSKKQYSRVQKHKATNYSDDNSRFFLSLHAADSLNCNYRFIWFSLLEAA